MADGVNATAVVHGRIVCAHGCCDCSRAGHGHPGLEWTCGGTQDALSVGLGVGNYVDVVADVGAVAVVAVVVEDGGKREHIETGGDVGPGAVVEAGVAAGAAIASIAAIAGPLNTTAAGHLHSKCAAS